MTAAYDFFVFGAVLGRDEPGIFLELQRFFLVESDSYENFEVASLGLHLLVSNFFPVCPDCHVGRLADLNGGMIERVTPR